MTTRTTTKGKNKKPLETTLGRALPTTDDDPIDLSHIRKPIDTSIFGLKQVLELFETATDEVRRYVAYECDIMYECRMCRTIFRSLANFILHKRNYCRESYNRSDHTNCRNNCQENEFYITQEEVDPLPMAISKEQSLGTTFSPGKCEVKDLDSVQPTISFISGEAKSKKNLNYVLRRLQGKQESAEITEQCLLEDVSNESKTSDVEEVKNNVALQKIAGSTAGVFQSMFRNAIEEYRGDLMKTEVMEIHNILEKNEAILGVSGKIVPSEREKSANFMCTMCKQKFSTKKTLTYHIKYKHNNTRLLYQCPECNDTFANAWSVFRHLYKIHRKTMAQVKRLRNQIHSNVIRRDQKPELKDANTTKTNSEATSDSQGKVDLENQQWMDDLEGDNDLQRCGGCGRKFERKAALHSHSQFCSKRIAICNSIKENNAKRVAEEKQVDKGKNSKVTTFTVIENAAKGSRRRKQLFSQKMCRVDYVKDGLKDNDQEKLCEDFIPDQDDGDETNRNEECCKEDIKNSDEIEVQNDENNDLKNEAIGLMQDANNPEKMDKGIEDFKPNFATVLTVERPRLPSGSESRDSDSDDVIYVDTVRLLPAAKAVPNVIQPVDDVNIKFEDKIKLTTMKNSIITRSKKNTISDVDNKDSVKTFIEGDIAEDSSKICDKNNPTDIILENSEMLQIKIVSVESLKSTNNNETNPKITTGTVDIVCRTEHADNKRKRIESASDSQPGNSKRKKDGNVIRRNHLIESLKVTLEMKSLQYIDKQKHSCLPCDKTFKSHKSLMKHMAVHFSWYRYRCRTCFFMSYSRSKCDRHVEVKHAVLDQATLKNAIIHIPSWKAAKKSTDFVKLRKKRKYEDVETNEEFSADTSAGDLSSLHEEELENERKVAASVPLTSTENSELHEETFKDDTSLCKPNMQDPSVRKMIMEVIFGNQEEPLKQEENEPEEAVTNDEQNEPKNCVEENEPLKCGEEDAPSSCVEEQPRSPDMDSSVKTEDTTEDFLGFHNSTEEENCCQVENPSFSSVVLRDNPRPVRNRVPTVQKDFLYDMAQILKPKGAKDKEVNVVGQLKEVEPVKKHNQIKTYSKDSKQKSVIYTKKTINKFIPRILKARANLEQDINMNSKDILKKHVTGDCK